MSKPHIIGPAHKHIRFFKCCGILAWNVNKGRKRCPECGKIGGMVPA